MRIVQAYLKSFGRSFTYDVRRNVYLWFGFLWGIPVPIFSIALDLSLSGVGERSLWQPLLDHPIHFFFLAHPILFALVFGAMGTVRHELERENEDLIGRLQEEALTDPLTGLHNRRYMMQEIAAAIRRGKREGPPFSVVMIDLNGFKAINESQGHLAGDRVLQEVAQSLATLVRESDTLARYGGDEFMILMYNDGGLVSLLERAEMILRERTGLGFEMGVARWPEAGDTPEALIAAADKLLRESKKRLYETETYARR